VHVFKAPLGGDGLGGLEPRAGVRDEADPGEDLIRLDHDMSPPSIRSIRGARSRNAASMPVCHRSGGSNTCESDDRTSGSIGIAFLT
jgi:hypothetical protein